MIYEAIIARLEHYAWPGNVRELHNVIESMVLMSDHPVLGVEDLPLDFMADVAGDEAGASAAFRLSESEADLIRRAIAATHGNLTRAARELDIAKRTCLETQSWEDTGTLSSCHAEKAAWRNRPVAKNAIAWATAVGSTSICMCDTGKQI